MAEYDKIAKYYDLMFADVFPYEEEARQLHEIFMENNVKSVLDASCGTGSHLLQLARLGYRCAGSDISPGMLEAAGKKAEKEGLEIDFFQGDIKKLTIDRKFDAVISLYGLPLMMVAGRRDPQLLRHTLREALQNIRGKITKNGIFVFNIINPGSALPYPGFGPWSEANINGIEKGDIKIVMVNKIRRDGEFVDFKDIYILQDKERTGIEILQYGIWLTPIDSLTNILEESGFRILSIYSSLSDLDPYREKSLDMTIISEASREIR